MDRRNERGRHHVPIDQLQSTVPYRYTHNILGSRINCHLINLFNRPLTLCIKTSDGIDFISPQFDTIRALIRQIINVNDAFI